MNRLPMSIVLVTLLCVEATVAITYYDVYKHMKTSGALHQQQQRVSERSDAAQLPREWEEAISRMSLKQLDQAIARLRPFAERLAKHRRTGHARHRHAPGPAFAWSALFGQPVRF